MWPNNIFNKTLFLLSFLTAYNSKGFDRDEYHTVDTWSQLSNKRPTQKQSNLFKVIEKNTYTPLHDDSVPTYKGVEGEDSSDMLQLYHDKFVGPDGGQDLRKYNPELLPITKEKEHVDVEVQNFLMKIVKFDMSVQTLDVIFWLEMRWQDEQLTWDPEDYGGLRTLKVKPSTVWIPDLVLYNSANGGFQLTEDPSTAAPLHVFYNGAVRWMPIVRLTLSCPLNLKYWVDV